MEETENKTKISNPIISGIFKIEGNTESVGKYVTIAAKTVYFLVLTIIGVMVYFLLHNIFKANAGIGVRVYAPESIIMIVAGITTIVSAIVCAFFRRSTQIVGSIYCIAEGYLVAAVSSMYAIEFSGIILMALSLTIIIILTMLFLYASGIVKVGKTFKTVMLTLLICSVLSSILYAILYVFAPYNPIVILVQRNSALVIICGLIGVVIASLFLITDFNAIQECIDNNLPKEYEWSAAFGLAFTVIWLYLKLLRIIAIFSKRN